MQIQVSTISPNFKFIVTGLFEGNNSLRDYSMFKKNDILKNIVQLRDDFNGAFGECFLITLPEAQQLLIIGLGDKNAWNTEQGLKIGGKIYCELSKLKIKRAAILIEDECILKIGYGALLRSFKFDKYKTRDCSKISYVEEIMILVRNEHLTDSVSLFESLKQEANGVFLARSFITEPPNILYPHTYAESIKHSLTKLGADVEIFDTKYMQEHKMGALLGVAQGSSKEPKLVVIKWNGADIQHKSIAFIGKGVTFDTGGISLKPTRGMEAMKYDMAGSAVIVGAMHILAERKARINAVGVLVLVENAIDGNAQRPSDIVVSMSGQTIEVLNTDAEGRLILADALWYTQNRFAPQCMIDLATLTGAIIVALGTNEYAGLFSNNEELAARLISAGDEVNEKLWRFPMNDIYNKKLNSEIADMRNIAPAGYGGDSIIAAQFLSRFVNNTCWAHLDIAGTSWQDSESDLCPIGAVGFGVRLLNTLVQKYYEIV
ncbi:leucyl aminopeptidase [Wolbachia endosymbiont of Howardula sp.]|uniref:leucyl aminopeptidase n=1 Tax=Wolbachia endosymbiont of Howardula sp. TaxID=2916816 RepID=UPI00217DF4F0|nr:leucyl aminopeptidase [Wolbachia endosymbiont of Howardula sp.]UWI82993.1 leucyl aminopeptidase [Wolbachia endosymbiont of Howardula sp.]